MSDSIRCIVRSSSSFAVFGLERSTLVRRGSSARSRTAAALVYTAQRSDRRVGEERLEAFLCRPVTSACSSADGWRRTFHAAYFKKLCTIGECTRLPMSCAAAAPRAMPVALYGDLGRWASILLNALEFCPIAPFMYLQLLLIAELKETVRMLHKAMEAMTCE